MIAPTQPCRRPWIGSKFCGRPLGRMLALAAVAAPAYLTAPTPAFANPIAYLLNPPFMGSTLVGGVCCYNVRATGTFTFDASGPTLDAVNIFVTADPVAFTGTLNFTIVRSVLPSLFTAFASNPGVAGLTNAMLLMNFLNPLSGTPDPVRGLIVSTTDPVSSPVGQLANADATSGTAVPAGAKVPPPPVPTPEPGSLALLGGALGLFLLRRESNRRGGPVPGREASVAAIAKTHSEPRSAQ